MFLATRWGGLGQASVTAETANPPATPARLRRLGPRRALMPHEPSQYTKEVVAFGARPIGSANHKKLEEYILGHLKGTR